VCGPRTDLYIHDHSIRTAEILRALSLLAWGAEQDSGATGGMAVEGHPSPAVLVPRVGSALAAAAPPRRAARRRHGPHAAPFYLPYIVPLLTVLAHNSAAAWHAVLPPAFVWVVVPAVDVLVGSPSSPEPHLDVAARRDLERRWSFRLAVLLWAPVQLATLVWASQRFGAGGGPLRDVALVASMGLIAAGGINCSHELLHRRTRVERLLAQLLLVSVCYGHFFVEHARGHHKTVATPEDPATLAFGDSFYRFLPRTVLGGFRSAWSLEADRLRASRRRVWSPHNAMLWYITAPFVLFIFPLGLAVGTWGVALFLAQSAVAVTLLEQINAMEHYGLVRARRPDGTFEAIAAHHSWDAPQCISNYLLFKLQRHADHHLHAAKRYQVLELTADSPQLPGGYLTLAPCLLIPPLWRRVMDPVLARYQQQRLERQQCASNVFS
jgi:alkane 1-monooxygenase